MWFSSCIWNFISVSYTDICIYRNIHKDICTYSHICFMRVFLIFRILSDTHTSDCRGPLDVLFIILLDWDLLLMILLVPSWSTRGRVLWSHVFWVFLSLRSGGPLIPLCLLVLSMDIREMVFLTKPMCTFFFKWSLCLFRPNLFPGCMNLCPEFPFH